MKWNSKLVECLFKLRVDFFRTVFRLLGSRIINDILKINFRNIKMCPLRHLHLLPASERIETKLKHPLRLLLLCRNKSYYIFIETFRNELLLDISHKAMFIFLVCNAVQYFLVFTHLFLFSAPPCVLLQCLCAEGHRLQHAGRLRNV